MITNKLGLPQPFVEAATGDRHRQPRRYSVTEVLGGTCEAVLKRRHAGEQDEDVSDRVWAILGTAVHKVLQEAQAGPGQLQENWLSVEVGDGYELSGIFDLYDGDTGTVTDYKTCSVWKATVGDFSDWRLQVLLYCWMLRESGFKANNGEVVAIMRDHNKRKARTESGYPKHPVIRIGWSFTEDDFDKARAMIAEWFSRVREQELRDDSRLEPCSERERWHKPEKWAVMRKGQKRAVRLYQSEEDARKRADSENRQARDRGEVERHYVERRPGEDTKCESYCPVAAFCPHMSGVQ